MKPVINKADINFQLNLDYFKGKICSIHTLSGAYNYNLEQWMQYFVGWINTIDEFGIGLTHPLTGNKSFIFYSNIVAIVEEQVVYPDDPGLEQIYKNISEKRSKQVQEKKSVSSPGDFIDISTLTNLSNES